MTLMAVMAVNIIIEELLVTVKRFPWILRLILLPLFLH